MFEVGALIFKIQAAGAQVFSQDLSKADQAVKKLEQSSKTAKTSLEGQGKATDDVGRRAKAAKQPLDEQGNATETLAQKTARLKKEQAEQARVAREQEQAARELSTAFLVAGAAVGALVTLSVVKYAQFDDAMSNVRAATMATAEEQRILSEAALDAGADTAYSANEAAAAQEELAKAGQTVAQIVGGSLNGALALAAAGQLEVARSAEVMATVLTQFKLPAEDAARVADVLAAGAGKAQGSVDDLALALNYVGPLAQQAGWSLEETAGTISYFATQGILGEKAGTSLRGVLAALQSPSTIASKVMDQYGLSIYDANGQMLSAAEIAGQMQTAFGHLTQEERNAAMGRIFGNESLLAANLLYAGGADAIQKWTGNVTDAGFAAEQAAMRQDNLAGDIEKLGGAFDSALIRTGSGANDVLRDMVQMVTALVDAYGEMDPAMQQGALVIGGAVAAVLLLWGASLKGAIGLSNLATAAKTLNISMSTTILRAGAAALALAGIATVLVTLAQRHAEAEARATSFADALALGGDAAEKEKDRIVQANLESEKSFLWMNQGSAQDAAEKLGANLDDVREAALGNAEAMDRLSLYTRAADGDMDAMNEILAETGMNHVEAASNLDVLVGTIREQNAALERGEEIDRRRSEAARDGAEVTQSAADAYLEAAAGADELNSNLSELIETIFAQNGANLDAREAQRQWIEALAEFDAGLAENGNSLDLNTEAGRQNQENLDEIAARAMQVAESTTAAGGSYEDFRASLEGSRQALIDRINDLGIAGDAAEDMADEILQIPSKSEWKMVAETSAARSAIRQFVADASARTITIGVTTYAKNPNGGIQGQVFNGPSFQADGSVRYYAHGGGTEHHVAQIARAGEWRVWAEPETGGETYVPHAPSKRARSEEIMAQTAAILGGVYIPARAVGYADGGVSTPTLPPAAVSRPPIQVIFQNPVQRDVQRDAWEAAQIIGGFDE